MTRSIPLRTQDGTLRGVALVDDADFDRVGCHRWCLNSNGYVQRRISPQEASYLHREILGVEKGDNTEVDHVNRNRLDNRRINLRTASRKLNAKNVRSRGGSSKYRGVSWVTKDGVWKAQAKLDRQTIYLGRFSDEMDAARAVAAFWESRIPDFDYWSTSTKAVG